MRVHRLRVGKQELPSGTNDRRRVRFDSDLMKTLDLHVQRTNYIKYCQLNYTMQEHPSPIGYDWKIVNEKCRPVRHTSPLPHQGEGVAPQHLVTDQLTLVTIVVAAMRGASVENLQIQINFSDYKLQLFIHV